MAKSDKEKTSNSSNGGAESKKRKNPDGNSAGTNKSKSGDGMDEFDKLFSDKKKQDQETKKEDAKKEAARKSAKKARHRNDAGGSCLSSSKRNRGNDTNGADWVDDGLGGKYNKEGFTGRTEDGVKVFKRHILNKPGAGTTKDCPFDCDCCFI